MRVMFINVALALDEFLKVSAVVSVDVKVDVEVGELVLWVDGDHPGMA